MKKNYTLKITLAMLVVVLVSLVSFVGVYKGKNLVKEYSLGKDLSQRHVAYFNAQGKVEEPKESETTEEQTTEGNEENQETEENASTEEKTENTEKSEENVEQDLSKDYKNAKNIIEKGLTAMNAGDFEVRIEENGNIEIEVPTDVDASTLNQVMAVGKFEVKNQSSSETIVDSKGIKSASSKIDTTKYVKPLVTLNIKFTKDAINKIKDANPNYTDSEGKESAATFAVTVDGTTIYSDTASTFIESAKAGSLDLVVGQGDEGSELEKDYTAALVRVAQINNGELPINYEFESLEIVNSNINIKTIVLIACIAFAVIFVVGLVKFKNKAILPIISIVGMIASVLLVLRYTNVEITLFTILGLAILAIIDFIFVYVTLQNDKSFKDNFIKMLKVIVPIIIIAVVFCCSPYIQVSSLGMVLFWGIIIMLVYNIAITRVLIDK